MIPQQYYFMKKVLVIGFSQSGQLHEILDNFIEPFQDYDIDRVKIEPLTPYPFPWHGDSFYEVLPETVLEDCIELAPYQTKHERYDLIIIGYQPWYLSPSQPTTALLNDAKFSALMKDTPIVTVIGARNMWLNSQESIKAMIKKAQGKLVGNIPFIDKTGNTISAITILYWMKSGKKERMLGIFPVPGVGQEDINEAGFFGSIVEKALAVDQYENLQKDIIASDKIHISTIILFIEQRAKKLFRIWARTIKKRGNTPKKRKRWLKGFKYYLFIAFFIVAPIVLLVYTILFRPFSQASIHRKKDYFRGLKIEKK